ncbi:hypothetical protein QNH02_gp60 [Escherichia phage vB_EcoP_Bp7]|uniref:hypothetical protein n=1 Tax=Escherichia phage vB_EcoP_Bp7 TaxID=2593331 RepID=UPI0024ACF614|nr:hypothetical protein QNH02_gp60 [Escherichia phage vB_EcoP_Bp7]QDJ96649.1 hypothetical protein vBEcoP_Bp768 [Escherichia phage vB_EcoP_Bp7]
MAIRPKLNRVWTSNNSVARRDPGDEKYLKGWVAEIPTYQVLNYLQYKIDTTMLAQAERGIFEWGSDVSYGVGSLAWDETNKTIYVCTVANPNKTLRPSANSAQWSPSSIQVSRANYDSIVAAINAHIADVTTNPHKVTAAQIGAYNKSELDAIVANYRAMVQAHVTDYNNPHKLTAVQVGAVPVAGGAYTGEVTFTTVFLNDSKTAQIVNDGGLYLRNGSYYLGINGATGNAEVGTASSKSPVVTDLTFPTLKVATEPEYAVPEPIVNMPLIGSINLRAGIGKVNSSANEPVYAPQFGNALLVRHGAAFGIRGTEEVLAGGRQATLAIDTIFSGTPIGGNWLWDFGLGWFTILVTPNRDVRCEIKGTGTVAVSNSVTLPMNEWVRIVATYNAATGRVCLYINGVKAFDLTPSNLPTTGFREGTIYNSVSASYPNISTYLRNFRVWSDELTDKQVSTL